MKTDNKSFLQATRKALLEERGIHGHWEGELSSSALSTATAVVALKSYLRLLESESASQKSKHDSIASESIERLIHGGLRWLVQNQNSDGGWGDTTVSISNISTTALVWGAISNRIQSNTVRAQDIAEYEREHAELRDAITVAEQRCEEWLVTTAGSLEPKALAHTITQRYGRDRTFSVPILTTLVLTGRLGRDSKGWALIPQLPFELAGFPHQWFAALSLPVVSYALPALIAMGQVHHCHKPTYNPAMRLFRNLFWKRTKQKLIEIQPETGGFLEATPLTSFVVMALLGADQQPREVIDRGIDFLSRSVRSDGSWPIDTNLATWTTSLSMNAIALDKPSDSLTDSEIDVIRNWLLFQQYREEHPYTHAKPGGWAWTDLSGGVPDADDTSGALIALKNFYRLQDVTAAKLGLQWLMELQNRDGGIPTFCRGWGALPFDRSSTDITAHAIRAWVAWYDEVDETFQLELKQAISKGMKFLKQQQGSEGTWAPLWFGNQSARPEENLVYGTTRVLLACAAVGQHPRFCKSFKFDICSSVHWLTRIQNFDGGWGSEKDIPSSIEETGLAVEALCGLLTAKYKNDSIRIDSNVSLQKIRSAIDSGVQYLEEATKRGGQFPPSPIGFYFAKLWYFERMYPIIYTFAALQSFQKLTSIETSITSDSFTA